ncbi:MAG: ABC transporter ATP-binding protein [Bryobacteraceae bacterium]
MSSTTTAAPVLHLENIDKIYPMGENPVQALCDVSLDIFPGELIVILGPSGSGKSTLLHILGGLDVPTRGRVQFFDHDLTAANERSLTLYRREHVGFVFQFYNLIASLTSIENVALVTDIAANPMDPARALALVGLADRIHHFPAQLSGGEQQRVAIARAIAKQPELLLCDEPTGALDVETGRRVLAAIARIHAELGTTTVLITHNVAIAGMAHRVIRLSGGRVSSITRNTAVVPPEEIAW